MRLVFRKVRLCVAVAVAFTAGGVWAQTVHVGTCPPKVVANACAGPAICKPSPIYGGTWTYSSPLPKGTPCTTTSLPKAAHATCTGTGICSAPSGPTGIMTPKYMIVAIIYAPPGNGSSVLYTDGVTSGTTSSDSTSQGAAFTFGVTGNFIFTDTVSGSTTNTSSTQTNNTVTHGVMLFSTTDALDHGKDTFYILVHPNFDYSQQYPGGPITTSTVASNATMPPLILDVNELTGKEPIPAAKKAQLLDLTTSDLAQIAAADPFLAPGQKLDPNRFQLVDHIQLAGPDYQGAAINDAPYTETGSTTTCKTVANALQNTVTIGFSAGADFLGQGEKATFTASMTDGRTSTSGDCGGTAQTAALTPRSSTVGYAMPVTVYEDNVFHTYAFVEPPLLNPGIATVVRGSLRSAQGAPAASKLITVTFSDGTTRRIWTKPDGSFILAAPPAGAISIQSGLETAQAVLGSGQAQLPAATLKARRTPQRVQ